MYVCPWNSLSPSVHALNSSRPLTCSKRGNEPVLATEAENVYFSHFLLEVQCSSVTLALYASLSVPQNASLWDCAAPPTVPCIIQRPQIYPLMWWN